MTHPLDSPADPFDVARRAAEDIARLMGVERHDLAVTLGSGWGKAADLIGETVATVPATEITGFSKPALEGHVGTLRSVRTPTGAHVLVIGARTHYYEGHGVRRVVHSVRTAAATGARTMVLTNGAGGIRSSWTPGQPVLISDHINLTSDTPLEGATFIDMTDLYSARLREVAREVDASLDEGVYCQFRGPQYETPAEVRFYRTIGADLLGMSTIPEVIVARHCGMRVFGMSVVTNCANFDNQPKNFNDGEDVVKQADAAATRMSGLFSKMISAL